MLRHALLLTIVAACAACTTPARQAYLAERLSPAERAAFVTALGRLDRGDAEGALVVVQPVCAVEPWYVPAHVARQDALRRLGQDDEVARSYRDAAAALPGDGARVLLAGRTFADDAPEKAAYYRRALELDASSPWPVIALAYELLREAAQDEDEATRLSREGFLPASKERADRGAARRTEAEALARRAEQAHPVLAAAHALVADAMLASVDETSRRRRLDAALESARRAATLDPADPWMHVRLAAVLRIRGDDAGAAEELRSAYGLSGRAASVGARLARVLLDLSEDSEALDLLEAAAGVLQDDAVTWMNLGVARYRARDFAGAEEAYSWAARLAPDSPDPFEGLAVVRARAGDRDGAAEAMRSYLVNGGSDRERGQEFIDRMNEQP